MLFTSIEIEAQAPGPAHILHTLHFSRYNGIISLLLFVCEARNAHIV